MPAGGAPQWLQRGMRSSMQSGWRGDRVCAAPGKGVCRGDEDKEGDGDGDGEGDGANSNASSGVNFGKADPSNSPAANSEK